MVGANRTRDWVGVILIDIGSDISYVGSMNRMGYLIMDNYEEILRRLIESHPNPGPVVMAVRQLVADCDELRGQEVYARRRLTDDLAAARAALLDIKNAWPAWELTEWYRKHANTIEAARTEKENLRDSR